MMAASFPTIPVCGVDPPTNPVLLAALEYTKLHTTPATVNHCLRAAYFAVITCRKIPTLAGTDPDLIIYACLTHDLGWSKTPEIISKDKRFEVDGANASRQWIVDHGSAAGWDKHQVQLIWDSIALHTTPSIALHKEPEVVAVGLGIAGDIFGPFFPYGVLTAEEYKEVATAFPKLGLKNEVVGILCGLCRDKPQTTFDNFVGQVGAKMGLDGNGGGREEFVKEMEKHSIADMMIGAMSACDEIIQ